MIRQRVCIHLFTMFVFVSVYGLQPETTSQYRIRTIAFYNLENLFDTFNDSLTYDDDRTPKGKDKWTDKRYRQKLDNLAKVISSIGKDERGTGPDIIGLCELENRQVLQDLFSHKRLKSNNYQIIHYDSPDERGIDVALAYKKTAFSPFSHKSHRLLLESEEGKRDYTRDLLVVGGIFGNDELYILVNHWPSRSGGEERSSPLRKKAGRLNKRVVDSILRQSPDSRIIIMGDFNDNPLNRSIKHMLKTNGIRLDLKENEIFNPMEKLYKQGLGSLGYRDQWHMFDQILLTNNLVNQESGHYFFWKAGIYKPSYLITSLGRFRGYPKRTYTSGVYRGGYSDHFPVFVYLIQKVE